MSIDSDSLPPKADILVIGAGFGGLATALKLSELGAQVVLCEALTYPGGCASTFERDGYRFEAGATLFSGFGENQLFRTAESPEPRFTDSLTLDMAEVVPSLAGPKRPQDRAALTEMKRTWRRSLVKLAGRRLDC